VIALALGLTPVSIRLHPDPLFRSRQNLRKSPAWANAVVSYSGPAAQARASGCSIEDAVFESQRERSDVMNMARACIRLSDAGHFPSAEAAMQFVIDRADELVDRHWHRIEAVALALDERGRLNEREIVEAARKRRPFSLFGAVMANFCLK
jgi:hypothetical protein